MVNEPPFLFVLLVALVMAWFAWRNGVALRRSLRSSGYSSTQGIVVSSRMVLVRAGIPETSSVKSPEIVYGYEVGGRQPQGKRVAYEPLFITTLETQAKRVCARYPVGARVTVHYDPPAPEEACLEPSPAVSVEAALQLGAPLVVAIAAVLWMILA